MTDALVQPPQTTTKPFRAPLVETLQRLIIELTDLERKVWLCILSHVDNRGVAFPHVATIADKTAERKESIDPVLLELNAKGWLIFCRKGERDAFTRRMTPNVYQIPPDLIYLGENYRFEAVQIANSALTDTNLNMYESRFSLESGLIRRIITKNQNQNQRSKNQELESSTTISQGADDVATKGAGAGGYAANPPSDDSEHPHGTPAESRHTPTTYGETSNQPAGQNAPPVSGSPPPTRREPPPGGYGNPLPDDDLESYAWFFKRTYGPTLIQNARELYWVFGADLISRSIRQYHAVIKDGKYTVVNKTGFIIGLVKKAAGEESFIGEPVSDSPFSHGGMNDDPY